MTAIAEELDRQLQTLGPERAARCERLIRDLLALLEAATPPAQPPGNALRNPPFLLAHSFEPKPGIAPTKLGQLVDDLESGETH